MRLRLATFNAENLMRRFDFSGFRNQLQWDRTLSLFEIGSEDEYRQLEQARAIAQADDARQLSALAIAATRADIVCLQEIDNIEALRAFEFGYLYRMIGEGYRHKVTTAGNDSRGIDVAVMMRETSRSGEPIAFVQMTSHAHVTFDDLDVYNPALAGLGIDPHDRIFRRDCLEVDLTVGGRPLTLYCVHFKSMGSPRDGVPGREATMPVRMAEALAVRRIIEARFGGNRAAEAHWAICGDLNDYRERLVVTGDEVDGFAFEPVTEEVSCLDVFLADGFAENLVLRRPVDDRWTLYHTRGPRERHLCQLDYLLFSPALAARAGTPAIERRGQPWRTPFPSGQAVERFPRIGWDRPKASDHCPVSVEIDFGA